MPVGDGKTSALPWLLLICLASFAVYAPSLSNGFAHDDNALARAMREDGTRNSMVAELRPIGDYFAANYWEGYGGHTSHLYRPITILSYALTNGLPGGEAARPPGALPHHLINVLLHVWAVLLVFSMVRVLAPGRQALVAALVFGLHAIHSEVVAGIVGRAELFGFCFGAQAVLLFHGGNAAREAAAGGQSRSTGQIIRLIGCAALLFLAFCSKESALAWSAFLPVFAIAHVWTRFPREPLGKILGRPLLLTGAVAVPPIVLFLLLRAQALADMPEKDFVNYLSNPLYFTDSATRVLTGMAIWGYGLYKSLFPFSLVSDYGPVTFQLISSPLHWHFLLVLLAVLALGGWLAAGLLLARRHPLLFLSAASFLGFSVTTSNVPLAIGTIFGERLYYTPSLGSATGSGTTTSRCY
jgi:hypothetical protein